MGDLISDTTATDSNVLNVTLISDDPAAHVSGVEAIDSYIDNYIGS